MKKLKAGIVGGTGYTGSELIRLLLLHSGVTLEAVSSESRSGERITDVHPHLTGLTDLSFVSMDDLDPEKLDVLFLGLPHGVSMQYVKKSDAQRHCVVIDLSGDFRLTTPESYEQWYGKKHVIPELVGRTVYGMPELFRSEIKEQNLIANPGCYPTSSILPLAPVVKEAVIKPEGIIIDAKSGVTGAGATPNAKTHFPAANDNFSAYGLKTHRHTPEIQQSLERFGGRDLNILFTPHLLPVNRGILSTIYAKPDQPLSQKRLDAIYSDYYADEPFIRLRKEPPQIQQVRGTNFCDIYATYDERTDMILIISCIDNLVKGAAGQAVQNMNIRFNLEETAGLINAPLTP